MPAIPRLFSLCLSLAGMLPEMAPGQDVATGAAPQIQDKPAPGSPVTTPPLSMAPAVAPLKLDIARRDLKNFLRDEEAVAPHRSSTGDIALLKEVFMIGSPNISRAFFWDPVSCRLLGVIDLDAPQTPEPAPAPEPAPVKSASDDSDEESKMDPPSPYILTAAGPMPLFGSSGVSGSPRYFGFRLVGGMPEFLYTFGSLAVEERLWLDDGGKALKQRFAIPGATKGFQITLPGDWKERATVSAGTWKGNVLSVPKESVTEIIFSYRLTDAEPEPSDSN